MNTTSPDTGDGVRMKPETIEVQDLDQFVTILTSWHSQKVAVLQHMQTLPEGSEMVVDGATAPPVVMAGDILAGFKVGIELALIELGTLPFAYEQEPDSVPETSDAP